MVSVEADEKLKILAAKIITKGTFARNYDGLYVDDKLEKYICPFYV